MSTDGYLVCLTHEPNVRSEEVGNFSYDTSLKQVRDLIRDRVKIVEAYSYIGNRFDIYMGDLIDGRERAALSFLIEHPKCELGIVDEYGKRYFLEDGPINHIRYHFTGSKLCASDHVIRNNPVVFDQKTTATPCSECVDILKTWLKDWR